MLTTQLEGASMANRAKPNYKGNRLAEMPCAERAFAEGRNPRLLAKSYSKLALRLMQRG